MKQPFIITIIQSVAALQFRLADRILEVQGRQGLFHPLCSNSMRKEYVKEICTNTDSSFESFAFVSIPSRLTYSIGCVGNSECFAYPSTYCKKGVIISCYRKSCSDGMILVGNVCVDIGLKVFPGYAEAKEACSFRMLSIPREADRNTISQVISGRFDDTQIYFTSGFRKGSQWVWEDGKQVEFDVGGEGRCLALSQGQWQAVNCDVPGIPLCEAAKECIEWGKYQGKRNRTTSGLPCMKWNDPSVLSYGTIVNEQREWDHNYCRITDANRVISCFVSPNSRLPCDIPYCPEEQASINSTTNKVLSSHCGPFFFECAQSLQCIPSEFHCDFEIDCSDGSDEANCENFLLSFELVGALKIVDKVTEIWTYIPHVQGCAHRCIKSSLVCEAFSYEPRTQTCLLTDSPEMEMNVIAKSSSQFYRKRFSTNDVQFDLVDSVLRAAKNGSWAPVCNNDYSYDYTSSICKIFGYGLALIDSLTEKTRTLRRGWSVECIREPFCFSMDDCNLIKCSMCNDGICGDGSCVKRSQLCNLKADCQYGEDEMGCDDIDFRLVNGSESAGIVEVFFRGYWEPVCAQGLGYDAANDICKNMQMGTPSVVLSPPKLDAPAWSIQCHGTCSLKGFNECDKQAHIQCGIGTGDISGICGIRRVEAIARDPRRTRLARVVGGFETKAGAFPWTAAVKIKATGAHHCGASILDRTHLITAAHCFEEDRRPRSYTVVVGDWDNSVMEGHEQIFNVTRFYLYPLYEDLFSHDIAIIEIGRPAILFNDWAQPICLPPRDFSYQTGRKCVVSGWGSMGLKYPTRLQAALLPIIDRAECINSSRIYASMSRSAFCAGYLEGEVDSCQGDSGGPLACQNEEGVYVLAGVISWGDGCAQKNQPGIYTMVAPYLSWIENILKSHAQ